MVLGYPESEDDGSGYDLSNATGKIEVAPEADKEPEVVLKKYGIPWKSIITFAGVFFGQLLARSTVNGVAVFPEDFKGLTSLIAGSLVAAAVVYFKANVYTVPQAQKNVEVALNRAA